mmetsp:Transcript_1462/g.2454  ORF Transcript_1462/g.2454 Transcript_1462/m.2454 type:complete len:1085 (+) Transcript_1462:66-3320(+)
MLGLRMLFCALLSFATCQATDSSFSHIPLPGGGGITVTSMNLDKKIAGCLGSFNCFAGPSQMHAVADKTDPSIMYFSWTEDIPFGSSEAGAEGKIHVTKVKLAKGSRATAVGTASFDGFVRAAGIDLADDGVLGTLCAKHVPSWLRSFRDHHGLSPELEGFGPMMLAVCEVESTSMQPRTPWRIGKHWNVGRESLTAGVWGNYGLLHRQHAWLTFSQRKQTWTAWYGATVGTHSGFAFHTYGHNAQKSTATYKYPVEGVENRVEVMGPWVDHHRWGTGDHQSGSAMRYHPLLGDIAILKHNHGGVYMQQYGLNSTHGPAGEFSPPGHKSGRLWLMYNGDVATWEGGLRPCGMDWIVALVTYNGQVCAKVTHEGKIAKWNRIADWYGEHPYPNRFLKIATLGSQEPEAKCGSNARFLMGYHTPDPAGFSGAPQDYRRWLVEVDGDCNKITDPIEVTEVTTWAPMQDWTTTAEGAVAWVTGWAKDHEGKPLFHRWGTRKGSGKKMNGIETWGPTDSLPDTLESAYKEAQITVYWPSPRALVPPSVPAPTPHCQVWLYDNYAKDVPLEKTWAANVNQLTKEIMYLAGEGIFPLGVHHHGTSSVKVTGEGCMAFGFTTFDCSGSPGGVIRWNDDGIPDRKSRSWETVPLGIVSPAGNLAKFWGCNDCARCVAVCQGSDCQGIGKPAGHPSCSTRSAALMHATAGSTKWDGMDMPRQGGTTTGTALECQTRYAKIANCAYFTWWPRNGSCHIQDSGAELRPFGIGCDGCTTVYGPRACLSTSTTIPPTQAPTPAPGFAISSGDSVYLKTHTGKYLDVDGGAVRARYADRGAWQVLIIEKKAGGELRSGDTVYLRGQSGTHIDVVDENVQARWHEFGLWQSMLIERKRGQGIIQQGDLVCFRAHTGKHLDIQVDTVQARYDDCADWQTMRIQKEISGGIASGDSIHLEAHTGKLLDVEGAAVQARWDNFGRWETFVIQNKIGSTILSGDTIFLKAHTGNMVDVQGSSVQARWNEHGAWQELVIETAHAGAIWQDDIVYLRAHTGSIIEIEDIAVQCRWQARAAWQSLKIIKKFDRHLIEVIYNDSAPLMV